MDIVQQGGRGRHQAYHHTEHDYKASVSQNRRREIASSAPLLLISLVDEAVRESVLFS